MPESKRTLVILLHLAFFLTGISTVLIGQILPILSNKLSIDDQQAGQLFTAQFLGSLAGVFVFNYLLKKFDFIKTILFGLISVSVACALINSNFLSIVFLGFFLNGVGVGATLPGINLQIAELYPLRQAAALNILNFFWGLGAILSQPLVALTSTGTSFLFLSSGLSVLSILISAAIFINSPETQKKHFIAGGSGKNAAKPIWNQPLAWLLAGFQFFHIGLESGAGGWLTTYSARFPAAEGEWLSATPLYFLFFVLGRAVAPLWFRFLDENKFILISMLVVTFGIILIILAHSYLSLLFGASVLGFGTAAIFPTHMARFTKWFGEGATRNATPLFVGGSLGGAWTTWFMGFVSNNFGDLRWGIYVLLGSALCLVFLQLLISQQKKQS